MLLFKRIYKIVLIFFLFNLFTFSFFGNASAADKDASFLKAIKIKSMSLSIWPEYDDPRVLVMYQGEFDNHVSKPVKLRLTIPKGIKLNMAGAITKEGRHIHTPHKLLDKGDMAEISFEVNESTFYLEFYYDPFKAEGEKKNFNYLVTSNYHIDELTVDVQQPLKAKNFTLDPPSLSILQGQKGFEFHQYRFQDFSKEKEFALKAAYVKKDPEPSIKKDTGSSGSETQNTGSKLVVILLSIAISVIIALAACWFVTAQGRRVAGKAGDKNRKKEGKKFCSQCGKPLDINDKFCSGCGRKTKK